MRVSGIYKIQSFIKPERVYIGSSINIKNRWIDHLKRLRINKHYSRKLQNHFNKYGISDLHFSIILGCDEEDLVKTEQYFLDSYRPYFNNCPTAGNTLGYKHTDETKKKISEKAKGNKWCVGRKVSDEIKKRYHEERKGIAMMHHTPESKLKLSKAFKGKPLSEEIKDKMKIGWEKRRLKLNKPKSKYLIKKYGA